MKKEPAVVAALLAAVLAAVTQIIQAATESGAARFDVWTAVLVGLPLLAGIATRYQVIPVETVKEVIVRARTTTGAVNDLANRVDVATADRPPAVA